MVSYSHMISEHQNEKISLVAIDVDSLLAAIGANPMLDVLCNDERERADRYRTENLRNRFIAGRFLLRKVIGDVVGISPDVVEFSTETNGKPRVVESQSKSVHFSFSRSDEYAACAISHGGRIGIDVEKLRRMPDMELIAKEIFPKQQLIEWQQLSAQEQSLAFYRGWTRKEAVAKIDGRGVSKGVMDINVSMRAFEPSRCEFVRLQANGVGAARRTDSISVILSEWCPFPNVLVSLANEACDSTLCQAKARDEFDACSDRLSSLFPNVSVCALQRYCVQAGKLKTDGFR